MPFFSSMISKTCYQYAINLLARRDYSAFKLRQKLKSREYSEEEIEETLTILIDKNYLREDEYLRLRIQGLLYKGYSNSYIRQKCQMENLSPSDADIDFYREELRLTSDGEIDRLIQKKLRGSPLPQDYTERQKALNRIMNFLASKGHNYDAIKKGIDRLGS